MEQGWLGVENVNNIFYGHTFMATQRQNSQEGDGLAQFNQM